MSNISEALKNHHEDEKSKQERRITQRATQFVKIKQRGKIQVQKMSYSGVVFTLHWRCNREIVNDTVYFIETDLKSD